MRTNLMILFGCILLGATGYAYDQMASAPALPEHVHTDTTAPTPHAPDFSVIDLSGLTHHLREYQGKKVILHFWATWCAPCLEELPGLLHFAATQKNTVLMALASDKDDALIKRFLSRMPKAAQNDLSAENIIIARDGLGRIAQQYGTTLYPETFLIGTDGTIQHKWAGPQDWAKEKPL
jgi:cytochrome c biogenesis protein CcmG, thiol:disulfide interchange protein DsbE